ncbi:MAG: glycosyltransferase, partial [Calditrichaeota bacterium]
MNQQLVVLHEYGEPAHFRGLEHLIATKYPQWEIRYGEFSFLAGLKKALQTRRVAPLKRHLHNLRLMQALSRSRNMTVILGMAPFDFRLVFLRKLLRNHRVFYFTSWPYWDYTRYPKRLFAGHPRVISAWKTFLEKEIAGLITVTHRALTGLRKAYQIQAPGQVVYHAFDSTIFHPHPHRQEEDTGPLKCLFVGRLVREKGILKLLELIHRLPEDRFAFTLVGRGPLREAVAKSAASKRNVTYLGSIPEPDQLAEVYRNS